MKKHSVAIVMCAYNEAQGIAEFVSELAKTFEVHQPIFFVVDDCSTDETSSVLQELRDRHQVNVVVERNRVNLGHGPSTIRALLLGIESQSEYVISIDGDGQFVGLDVCAMYEVMLEKKADVCEGVRRFRTDFAYRKVVTKFVRFLVKMKCGESPADANTPLRIYRSQRLELLLSGIRTNSLIPNLFLSAKSRRLKFVIEEFPVLSIPRRGGSTQGVTWGANKSIFPNKKFLKFCLAACKEWFNKENWI